MALRPKGIRNSISATSAWFIGAAGSVAAISLSWWWKIDEARSPEDVPQAAFMQRIDAGRIWLTPLAVDYQGEGTDSLIVLEAVLENGTGRTQTAPFGAPPRLPELLADGQALPGPEMILLRDQEPLEALQPRLSEQVRFVWKVGDLAAKDMAIRFSKQAFKLEDNLYGQSSWLGFSTSAILPLTQDEGS